MSWELVLMILILTVVGLAAMVLVYGIVEGSLTAKHRRALELIEAHRRDSA